MSANESESPSDEESGGIAIETDPAVWAATIARFVIAAGVVWLIFQNVNLALSAGAVAVLLPMIVAIVKGGPL